MLVLLLVAGGLCFHEGRTLFSCREAHVISILYVQVTENFVEAKIAARGFGVLDVGYRNQVRNVTILVLDKHFTLDDCLDDRKEKAVFSTN